MKISNKELEEAKAKLHKVLNGPIYNHWCYRPYVQIILAALDSAENELETVYQAQQEPVAFRWRQLADGEFPASKWEYLPADRAEYFIEQVARNDRGVEYGYVYAAPPAPFPPSGLSVIDPDEWASCSPEYLKSRRHACSEAPRVWCEEEKNHYHPKNWPTDKSAPAVPDVSDLPERLRDACCFARTQEQLNSLLIDSLRVIEGIAAMSGNSEQQLYMASAAARDVLNERKRQVMTKRFTPERDDTYTDGELVRAAVTYAYSSINCYTRGDGTIEMAMDWPLSWDESLWKPTGTRRDLVKAGALILAEIERLDRLTEKAGKQDKDVTPTGAI
ncbi:hypothetical protein J8655_00060 [Dickeya oryzae]|uniref:hypothetical protein n=1 Tax=Dickeya oryzae TaxID=1240404 RepID=UPI001AECBCD8|nr:hypothetical protein [Dickeya oryzae]MBP2843907.1 hypothetical protein [Dickeya oryzae]